jgi:hypothetical protein
MYRHDEERSDGDTAMLFLGQLTRLYRDNRHYRGRGVEAGVPLTSILVSRFGFLFLTRSKR